MVMGIVVVTDHSGSCGSCLACGPGHEYWSWWHYPYTYIIDILGPFLIAPPSPVFLRLPQKSMGSPIPCQLDLL